MTFLKHSFVLLLLLLCTAAADTPCGYADTGCTTEGCHAGIRDIVPETLDMMQMIKKNGYRHGDPDGCVICHGGNPRTSRKKKAHASVPSSLKKSAGPKAFYPNPGALNIVKNTCGTCHPGYPYRVQRSLMNTAAGQIQGSLHAWGVPEVASGRVPWGFDKIDDPDGPMPAAGSKSYTAYMSRMGRLFPKTYPTRLKKLPSPDFKAIQSDPKLAGFTLQHAECSRCHLSAPPWKKAGDFRGTGCSACHMPYAPDGVYQGKDISIKKEPGHILRHRLAGNRKTGGIPVETCITCHNGGKHTGSSYTGQMESLSNSGVRLNPKSYLKLPGDLHHQAGKGTQGNPAGGLLCQDCHTSIDLHGDGNIHGTTLAQVEIECTDCHGTPEKLPWELALGHKDEFGKKSGTAPRGVSRTLLLSQRQFGFTHDPGEGYLISARGNPLGNVVHSSGGAVVHSARGSSFNVPLLKKIAAGGNWKTPLARTAMASIPSHMDGMECYTCHSTWTPQVYGSKVTLDFSRNNPPKIEMLPDYLRWELPLLGINGEGNVTPLIPGCQLVYTLIGKDRTILASDIMPENISLQPNTGSGKRPFSADTAPVQPHTSQRKARTCESCHLSRKTAGLGSGTIFPGKFDWTKIVTQKGEQTATVGTHWPLSRAFNKTELDWLLRNGTCMACHNRMDNPVFWKKVSTQGRLDNAVHQKLMNSALEKYADTP